MNGIAPESVMEANAIPLSSEQLWEQYHRYVAAIALRLLGRDHEIDDVVQDVFLEAFRGMHTLRDAAAVRGWLATITVRTVRRRLRVRRVKHWLGVDGPQEYEEIPSQSASPEQRLLLARVYRALDGLAVELRLAWTLRMIEGHSLEEVAVECECSLATVKRRIAAAQETMERELSR